MELHKTIQYQISWHLNIAHNKSLSMNFHGRALSLKQKPEVSFKANNCLPYLFSLHNVQEWAKNTDLCGKCLIKTWTRRSGWEGLGSGGRGGPDDRGLIFPRFPLLLHHFTLEMFLFLQFLQNLCRRRKTILIWLNLTGERWHI